MPQSIYIYYKASHSQHATILVSANKIIQAAKNHCKYYYLQYQLNSVNNLDTWLEVYHEVDNIQELNRSLNEMVQQCCLLKDIEGIRHSEYFYST